MRNNLKCTSIIIMALLIIILLAAFYLKNKGIIQFPVFINEASSLPLLWFKKPLNNLNKDNVIRCTADVKQCPNGSYVGRVAPSCSFAPCPEDVKY